MKKLIKDEKVYNIITELESLTSSSTNAPDTAVNITVVTQTHLILNTNWSRRGT